MSAAPSIRSEVGQLRTVLLHRPGDELRRITPSTMDDLLFDELLWVEEAQREHDAFADVLRRAGVEVRYVEEMLAAVIADQDVAERLVARHVTETTCGPQAVGRVRELLLAGTPAELVDHLVAGVTLEEVELAPGARQPTSAPGARQPRPLEGLVAAVSAPTELVLDPVPNLVFTRDSSAWIGEGAVVSPMNRLVRQREADLVRTVYRFHPDLAGAPIWFGDEPQDHHPATFEGGDLLVVGDRGLAIGMSERTTPAGVETLATRLFAAGVVDRILAVDLPKVRAAMHLDTIVTQVDVDAFVTYPAMTGSVRCFAVTPAADGGVHVAEGGELVRGLAWAAGLDHARAIEPGLGSIRAEREQWNDANNTLAIAPAEVVAYARNEATNEVLDAAGITVHTIPSAELPRGRGGPRCMSCPIRRDPVPTGSPAPAST